MDIEELIERVRGLSAVMFALPIGVAMAVANLLPAVAPGSALLALVATLLWFPAALASFAVVTWLRDDNWLVGGLIVGLTPVVARLLSDLITRSDLFASSGWLVGLATRAVIAVPLCGAAVFGARWLTMQIAGADTRSSVGSSRRR